MQTKLFKLVFFLTLSGLVYAMNFYFGYLYESKIQQTISVKYILSDIATNGYLLTESFDLAPNTDLNTNPELKESLLGRLNLLKLNVSLLKQQEELFSDDLEEYNPTADSLKEKLQGIEMAIEVLTSDNNEASDPLSKKVALSSAIREVSRLTDFAYTLEDRQNLKLNTYHKWLKFHTGLDAGLFISALIVLVVIFVYPNLTGIEKLIKDNEKLQVAHSNAKKSSEKLSAEKQRVEVLLAESEQSLRIANYSLAKKNAAEYRSKQDFDHFVLLVGNRFATPLSQLKKTLKRLEEQLKSGKPEIALQSVESAYDRTTNMNRMLEAVQQMGQSLNSDQSLSTVYLGPLLAEVIAMQENAQSANFSIQQNLPEVKAPKEALVYILTELVSNALNQTPSDTLEISIAYGLQSEVHSITISDNGILTEPKEGLKQITPQLLTPEEKEGTPKGLGLIISRYLAQRIGGNLTFQANKELNQFTFEWPAKT